VAAYMRANICQSHRFQTMSAVWKENSLDEFTQRPGEVVFKMLLALFLHWSFDK
jgi:hypothetical protein